MEGSAARTKLSAKTKSLGISQYSSVNKPPRPALGIARTMAAPRIAVDAQACSLRKSLEGGDDQDIVGAVAAPAHRYSHRSPGRTNAM